MRGRNKRISESNEPLAARTQESFQGPPTHLHQRAQAPELGFKDLQEEQAQGSDDSSSSMSNVDKIIDAVSKGIFDCGDRKQETETPASIVSKPSTSVMGKCTCLCLVEQQGVCLCVSVGEDKKIRLGVT